jgi:hypothetical protein
MRTRSLRGLSLAFAMVLTAVLYSESAATLVVSSTNNSPPVNIGTPVTFTVFLNSTLGGGETSDFSGLEFVIGVNGLLSSPTFTAATAVPYSWAGVGTNNVSGFAGAQAIPAAPVSVGQLTVNITVAGTYTLYLVDDNIASDSFYSLVGDPANLNFSPATNTVIGGLPAVALSSFTAVPEANAYMFGGIASVLGGVVAWRRRSQAA